MCDSERSACDITLADFDGVTFHVTCLAETKNKVKVSMSCKNFAEFKKNGTEDVLNANFPGMVVNTEAGFDVTVEVDLDAIKGKEDATLKNLIHMKRDLLGAPLGKILKDVAANSANRDMVELHYRPDESVWVKPGKDQITVVYLIRFRDADDVIIAKVFLQEFSDARRNVTNAPAVSYSKNAPGELAGIKAPEGADIGYVTFVLFKRQCEASQHENTITNVMMFRDYLHYHIKCAKANMHSRMRARCDAFLKVLNRAKIELEKPKTTASGKTFVRK
jgi:actin related protein 2/3 complex, subunit 2